MSSGRESVGDLIPQDVLEVFTQERQSRRGKRSRRRNTISRAFSWFKNRRRKNHRQNKDLTISLLTAGSTVPIPLPSSSTAPKVESEEPRPVPHFQENVFIEGNRPKYVQDLHTEAQEGLKLLQQNENRNGVDFPDDQSVVSTATARTDDDMSFSELQMSGSESTAADTISTRSISSYQSSRSGLTRQGSTFRPLKEDKKRRSKGKKAGMVTGIPRHVQKELGLDRAAWIASQFTDAQLSNGGISISTVIPNLDSISVASVPDGAIMHLRNMNSVEAATEGKPQLLPQEGLQDDLALLQNLLPQSFDPLRSNSLAVPWMTTLGNSSSNPVMYVSPEATYMSKIIPNAILPPSVDVVELSRNRSHSSVRMVSKSSLASASPAPSRASSRASSRLSSRAPSSRISSRASTRRTATLSECSNWSRSGSSETLVSDSSTISDSSTPRVASRTSQVENKDGPALAKDNPGVQNTRLTLVQLNGKNRQEEAWKKSESPGQFNRSLSVTKKSKRPPPPPSRSHSLHSRMYARTSAENKHLENGSQNFESPYNDYTSQNGNTTVPSNENLASKRAVLAELNLKNVHQMHTRNIPYSHANRKSQQNNLKHFLPSIKSLSTNGVVASPAVTALMALLDVPDPPKVLAPPPPPPETWAHNQHTFELLCGPGPFNYERWAQKKGLKIPVPSQTAHRKIQATNVIKDNTVAPKTQTQEDIATDMQHRTHVHPPYGNTLRLPGLSHVLLSRSATPPPEHIPPLPPTDQDNPLKADTSALSQGPFDEVICPPPHPLFPPPPPPKNLPHQPVGQDDTEFPSPPMPASLMFLLEVPPVSQVSQQIPLTPPVIPPPPPVMVPPPTSAPPPPPPPPVPTPPPPFSIPPPPVPTPPRQTPPDISTKQVQITSTPVNIPPPPPLPTDLKKEVRAITAERKEKQQSPPTTHTVAGTEESPTPMVTPSLLQTVRLRSIRANTSQAETPSGHPKPKHQTTQDTPQKPKRSSLILITPNLLSQSATDQRDETLPATTIQENQVTTPSDIQQPKAEPMDIKPEHNHQVSIRDKIIQQATTELIKESTSAQSVPQIAQEIQNASPEPSNMLAPAEPNVQSIVSYVKEIQTDCSKTEDKQSSKPEQDDKHLTPQTFIPTSPKFSPAQKVPPASVALPSMCLQEAVRLKTAAMSSTDSQTKRLSLLHSPLPFTGTTSETSTANFIFSKNTKNVGKAPSSPESKSDLRMMLMNELNSVSQTSKPATDTHSSKAKVPPPVAKKPSGRSENITQNASESNMDTEHVQTAGQ